MTERSFEIGIVLAGAVSAGAYSAGVMDFIIEALDAYELARVQPGWDGPTHSVRVPVMSGASAGGMTAAMSALHAFHALEHLRPEKPVPDKILNRLYSSWVSDISIQELLKTADLEKGREAGGVKSVLCSDILDQILEDALVLGPAVQRKWLGRGADQSLRLMLTLTNLRGVPYSFSLVGVNSQSRYGMFNHGDYLDFKFGDLTPQDGCHVLDITQKSSPDWDRFKAGVLATGAFPVGLKPRLIDRPSSDYKTGKVGYEDATGKFIYIPPDTRFQTDGSYQFVSVDGGTIDNEPLELARRYLAGDQGHNPQDGVAANRAVILIAPFPKYEDVPPASDRDAVIHVVGRLFSALIDQARFKPEELAKAENDKIFSRFVISPSRPDNGNPLAKKYPIASGALGGFSGFLHESFRRHDYLLGRRNAQAFLRWNFALPETNALFKGQKINERWYVRDIGNRTDTIMRGDDSTLAKKQFANTTQGDKDSFGYPIIPLVGAVADPIIITSKDMPNPDAVDRHALHDAIKTRSEKVVDTLVDVDFQAELHKMDLFTRTVASLGAKKFGTEILSLKAAALIDHALDELKQAFS